MKLQLCTALLFAGAVFGQPSNGLSTGKNYFPWEHPGGTYCAKNKITSSSGVVTYTPAPGVLVNPSVSVQVNSGFHAHNGPTRPVPELLFTSTPDSKTDANGCISFIWSSPESYAGWYTFQMIPADPGFKPYGSNNHFVYYDWGLNGLPVALVPYDENAAAGINQAFGAHNDGRHIVLNSTDNARFGTRISTVLMFRISYDYFLKSGRLVGGPAQELDLIRGSLPEGGAADNERTSQLFGPYLFASEWLTRPGEEHGLGVEWDVSNPSNLDGNINRFLLLEGIAELHGCRLGKNDQYGTALSSPGGSTGYWASQDVVHIVCSVAPKIAN